MLWAASTDLVPVTPDIQVEWTVLAGCTEDTDEWNCVDEGVPTNDGSTSRIQGNDDDAVTEEFNVTDAPGDFVSTNSITLRTAFNINTTDDNDRVDIWLEVSGVQSGGTKCASDNDTTTCPDCTLAPGSYVECSFTDAAWNSLSESDIDNLSIVFLTVENNSGMPDQTQFVLTATDLVLDYSNVAPTARRMTLIGVGP
jgi:hypothetical protein